MLRPFFDLISARLVIPSTFNDCLTYGQRQEFMWNKIKELEERLDELSPTQDDDSETS